MYSHTFKLVYNRSYMKNEAVLRATELKCIYKLIVRVSVMSQTKAIKHL